MTASTALREPLQRYLHALWTASPMVEFGDQPPHLAGAVLHLPARHAAPATPAWHWYRAAAAHAAAHRVYSPAGFDGRGLAPIARALVGLLEDARVELLACRELPGLWRLWAPLHTVRPDDGDDFATLMLRLSRALLDPGYVDPHPWIAKGRALFFADGSRTPALCRPDDVRRAASRLGHDIGQMRLGFDFKGHRPGPDYRDDSRWMFPPAEAAAPAVRSVSDAADAREPPPAVETFRYPEWDHLIERMRQDWCAVTEREAVASHVEGPSPDPALTRSLVRMLASPPHATSRRAEIDGDALDLDAAVRLRVERRLDLPPDPRVFRRRVRAVRRARRVLIVIDGSASSGDRTADGTTMLAASARIALHVADALARTGADVAIQTFRSNGRHGVAFERIQDFGHPLDDAARARLAGLAPGLSTRLGTAIRHAVRQLTREARERHLLVIGDGEPHDVDVHDPHYLVADARHAVREATRAGVTVSCVLPDGTDATAARRIFGRRCGPWRTLRI